MDDNNSQAGNKTTGESLSQSEDSSSLPASETSTDEPKTFNSIAEAAAQMQEPASTLPVNEPVAQTASDPQTSTTLNPQSPPEQNLQQSPTPQSAVDFSDRDLASFPRRLAAVLVDGILIGIVNSIIGFALGFALGIATPTDTFTTTTTPESAFNPLTYAINMLISWIYYVSMTGKLGQTLGKMALGIKVVKKDSNELPGFSTAILREVVGKLLSLAVFVLGYLWMLWDKDKQTWHDKIAGTVVVKIKS